MGEVLEASRMTGVEHILYFPWMEFCVCARSAYNASYTISSLLDEPCKFALDVFFLYHIYAPHTNMVIPIIGKQMARKILKSFKSNCQLSPSVAASKIGVLKKVWLRVRDVCDRFVIASLTPKKVPGRNINVKNVIICMDAVSLSVLLAIA